MSIVTMPKLYHKPTLLTYWIAASTDGSPHSSNCSPVTAVSLLPENHKKIVCTSDCTKHYYTYMHRRKDASSLLMKMHLCYRCIRLLTKRHQQKF